MPKIIFFSSHRFVCGKSKRGSTHLQVWKTYGYGFMVILILCCLSTLAVDDGLDPLEIPQMGLVAWWKFDEGEGKSAIDSVTLKRDAISGNFRYLPGVSGSAIKFDGFTTHIVRKAGKAPRFAEAFSIEAWVALQVYPWNWTAIVNREKDHKADKGKISALESDLKRKEEDLVKKEKALEDRKEYLDKLKDSLTKLL